MKCSESKEGMAVPMNMYFNGSDWVIAESAADAADIMVAQSGITADTTAWHAMAPDERLWFWFDGDPLDEDGERVRETKTVAEWVAERGRGYVASADY